MSAFSKWQSQFKQPAIFLVLQEQEISGKEETDTMVHKMRVLLAWSQFLQLLCFVSFLWELYKIFYSVYKLQRGTDLDCFVPKVCCLIHLPVINLLLLKVWVLSVSAANAFLLQIQFWKKQIFLHSGGSWAPQITWVWDRSTLSVFYGSTMTLYRSHSWMLHAPALSQTITHSSAELSASFPGLTECITADLAQPPAEQRPNSVDTRECWDTQVYMRNIQLTSKNQHLKDLN